MELLVKLYEIHSKSGNEKNMRDFVENCCRNLGAETTVDEAGNLYAVKGDAETYPCVVSHLDQVQVHHAPDFMVKMQGNVIYAFSESFKGTQGLGADDKNGIWICLKALAKYKAIKVAFFVGEETGCVGSGKADMDFFSNVRFVLQCDRRGNSDFITSIYSTELCGADFIKDVHAEDFGYKETSGMLTDSYTLKRKGLGVACCNISCGYYSPHTDGEVTVVSDLCNCFNFVCNIIENCTRVYKHEYVAPSYNPMTTNHYAGYHMNGKWYPSGCGNNGSFNSSYDDDLYDGYDDEYLARCYSKVAEEETEAAKDAEKESEKEIEKVLTVKREKTKQEEAEDEAFDELYEVLHSNPYMSFDEYWDWYGQYIQHLRKRKARRLYDEIRSDLSDYYKSHIWHYGGC